MKFHITIERDEDGRFCASCPTLPGCCSQGDTHAEAVANITEAIEAYLESLIKAGDPIPLPIEDAIVEIDLSSIEGAA